MADRPILFSAPMVRALRGGRKTQTRRILTAHCEEPPAYVESGIIQARDERNRPYRWPRSHAVGDRLWVREAFMPLPMEPPPTDQRQTRWEIAYAAGGQAEKIAPEGYDPMLYNYERWSPSIHMPRWASRITLIVEAVKVERLQDISEDDADAECFAGGYPGDALPELFPGDRSRWSHLSIQQCFARLCESINGPGSWDANPWCVAIEFQPIFENIDRVPHA